MAEPDKFKELRKAFPKGTVGQIPKGGRMLDYVGHAAVTDRLLEVDPQWNWEPFAVDEYGLPKLDAKGNLWIKLTVLGVTRPGVGDGPNMKELVSDALRNAAMRFGVALDLWSKEELESSHEGAETANAKPQAITAQPAPGLAPNAPAVDDDAATLRRAKGAINVALEKQGYVAAAQKKAFIFKVLKKSTLDDLSDADAVMTKLEDEAGVDEFNDSDFPREA
jgi:hypothetical protein